MRDATGTIAIVLKDLRARFGRNADVVAIEDVSPNIPRQA
jgi:hypothetical protein